MRFGHVAKRHVQPKDSKDANQRSREQSSHKIPSKTPAGERRPPYPVVGNAFRTSREQLGWSQEKFAEKALVSDGTVRHAEDGQHLQAATHRKLVDAINKARAEARPPIEPLVLPYPSKEYASSYAPPPIESTAPAEALGLEWTGAVNWHRLLVKTMPILTNEQSPPANPDEFYRGAQITTAQLNENCDIRRMFIHKGTQIDYPTLLKQYVQEALTLAKERKENNLLLLSGYAGSGKSTALQRIAYDLARDQKGFCGLLVLEAYELNPRDLISDLVFACNQSGADVVALFLDEASKNADALKATVKEIHRQNLPVCFFVAEQPNKCDLLPPTKLRFDLGHLLDCEIEALLEKLEEKGCLGKLDGLSPRERLKFFKQYADNQMLVALRRATNEGQNFDDIIHNEFKNIPQELGRELYRMVALMNTFELPFPVEAARRIIGHEKWNKARGSCQEIVLRDVRTSDLERVLRARHQVVAQIIFEREIRGAGTADDAEAFAHDASKMLYGLNEIRNRMNRRAIEQVVFRFLRHPKFIESLEAAGTLGDLARSICLFDEADEEEPNLLVPRLTEEWRVTGHVATSYLLLKEVVAKVGWPTCRSLPTCFHLLAVRVLEDFARDTQEILDLLIESKNSHEGKMNHGFIALGIAKLYESIGTEQSLNAAIGELESVSEIRPPIPAFMLVMTYLIKLLEGRNHSSDSEKAIHLLERVSTIQPPVAGWSDLLIHLSLLLEKRKGEGDLDKAIGMLESACAIRPPLSGLSQVVIELSVFLEKRDGEGDTDKNISQLEVVVAIEPYIPGWSHVLTRLCALLTQRNRDGDLNNVMYRLQSACAIRPPIQGWSNVFLHQTALMKRGAEGDLDKAIQQLDEGFELMSAIHWASALVHLCLCLAKRHGEGDLDNATVRLKTVVEIQPPVPYWTHLLICYAQLLRARGLPEDEDTALSWLERIIESVAPILNHEALCVSFCEVLQSHSSPAHILKAIQTIEKLIAKSNQTPSIVTLLTEFGRLIQIKDLKNGATEAIQKTEALLPRISDRYAKERILLQLSILYESRAKVGDLDQAVRVLNDIKSRDTDPGLDRAVVERLTTLQSKMSQTRG
jgi:tetratricopeptide (TPR) repeat protein